MTLRVPGGVTGGAKANNLQRSLGRMANAYKVQLCGSICTIDHELCVASAASRPAGSFNRLHGVSSPTTVRWMSLWWDSVAAAGSCELGVALFAADLSPSGDIVRLNPIAGKWLDLYSFAAPASRIDVDIGRNVDLYQDVAYFVFVKCYDSAATQRFSGVAHATLDVPRGLSFVSSSMSPSTGFRTVDMAELRRDTSGSMISVHAYARDPSSFLPPFNINQVR